MSGSGEQEAPIAGQISDSGEQEAPSSAQVPYSGEEAPSSGENSDSTKQEAPNSEENLNSGEAAPISGEMSMTEAPISGKISDSEQEYRPISPKMSDPWKQEEIPNCDDYVPWLIDNTEFVQELVEELMIGDPPLLDYSNENPALPPTVAATKPSSSSSESAAENVELGKGKIDEKGKGKEKQEDGQL
ncbi:hypothetical protein ACFX1R_027806 [Malus domestica]